MLSLYNTINRKIEEFVPINSRHVKMYVCGPTVYDKIHIGNARPLVVFDVLSRLLRYIYPKVTYVRNITDVDDKINNRLISENISLNRLTKITINDFVNDCYALNNLKPDFEPKATDHINEMIVMIQILLEKKYAYVVEGNVFFNIKKYKEYGHLSNRTLDEMISGSRIEVAKIKKNPGDFTLWKPSSKEIPGWESPWGIGRPGWHIECSAMSKKYLGEHFDIHGGGADLIFPHHENEIAQSTCANSSDAMANFWIHNGYVNIENQKMSKSLKNFVTIFDLLKNFKGEIIRFFLLQAHYRAPLNYNYNILEEINNSLSRLYRSVENVEINGAPDDIILKNLMSDLNTPKAIARAHYLSEQANKGSKEASQLLKNSSKILGILESNTDEWFKTSIEKNSFSQQRISISKTEILNLIKKRSTAKLNKNFILADEIRSKLDKMGILLEDKSDGTDWRFK